jgi:hypothetical protein
MVGQLLPIAAMRLRVPGMVPRQRSGAFAVRRSSRSHGHRIIACAIHHPSSIRNAEVFHDSALDGSDSQETIPASFGAKRFRSCRAA